MVSGITRRGIWDLKLLLKLQSTALALFIINILIFDFRGDSVKDLK